MFPITQLNITWNLEFTVIVVIPVILTKLGVKNTTDWVINMKNKLEVISRETRVSTHYPGSKNNNKSDVIPRHRLLKEVEYLQV